MFSTALKDAGPLAVVTLVAGVVGFLLAGASLALAKNTAKVVAALGLLVALAALGLGFAGYSLGMTATDAAVGNVPDDLRDALLRKGTEEARLNLTLALIAAALPLLLGAFASLRARFHFGLVLVALGVAASVGIGAQLVKPLPPGEPPVVEAPGLTLAESKARLLLHGAALISLMPDGLWANGARVDSLAAALDEPLVKARNSGALPVLVDARVKFSALADLLEAAAKAQRGPVLLVVRAPSGERRAIDLIDAGDEPRSKDSRPTLTLTVLLSATHFSIGAVGGTLPKLPADPQVLNDKLAEVKGSFPDVENLRVTADPELPFAELVKALDAVMLRDGRALYPQVRVGRFELPKSAAE